MLENFSLRKRFRKRERECVDQLVWTTTPSQRILTECQNAIVFISTPKEQDHQSICLPRQSGDRPQQRRGRVRFVNPLQVREWYLPTAFDQLGKEKGAEMQQVRWTEKGRERGASKEF